jgi:hypothetical protein
LFTHLFANGSVDSIGIPPFIDPASAAAVQGHCDSQCIAIN